MTGTREPAAQGDAGDTTGVGRDGAEGVGSDGAVGPHYNSTNIWTEWFPEDVLARVLAGQEVIADIGQVKGAWKQALTREVRCGRLTTWKGHWFPAAGAPFGMGPLKTCYGTPEVAVFWADARAALSRATGV